MRRISIMLAAVISSIVVLLAGALPSGATQTHAGTTEATIQSTEVLVAVSCSSSGGYSWNATIVDGPAYKSLAVQYMFSSCHSDGRFGGCGGDFRWKSGGRLVTGKYGLGTSSTFYGNAGNSATSVTIRARINGVTGVGSDTC